MFADLHLHTTASDGILKPAELVMLAKEKGFKAIAITDHDTTDGLAEAFASLEEYPIEIIPGLELSTVSGEREIHLLGYYPDITNKKLRHVLGLIIEARQNRAEKMVVNKS